MLKIFSDPSIIVYIGMAFTLLGVATTTIGTVKTNNLQSSQQSKLEERTEEITLLNSQMSYHQNILREKTEKLIQLQNSIADDHKENSLINVQISNLQREQNLSLKSVSDSIEKLNELLNEKIFSGNNSVKGNKTLEIENVSVGFSIGKTELHQKSVNIDAVPGRVFHTFDGNLSFLINIENTKNKKPTVSAIFSSLGSDIYKIKTDISGKCFKFENYKIEVESIEDSLTKFSISRDKSCAN